MPKSNHYILKYGDWKFGQENASAHILHQPPFAFPAPKEKHKCISASARTQPASAWTEFLICIFFNKKIPRLRGRTRVHADALGCTRTQLGAHVHANGVLPYVDAVNTCPWVKLHPEGKNGRTKWTSRRSFLPKNVHYDNLGWKCPHLVHHKSTSS
jgi:hypothetical protein